MDPKSKTDELEPKIEERLLKHILMKHPPAPVKEKGEKDMYQIEHDELFEAIRHGNVINNGDRMMNNTLVAILGREAA